MKTLSEDLNIKMAERQATAIVKLESILARGLKRAGYLHLQAHKDHLANLSDKFQIRRRKLDKTHWLHQWMLAY